MIILLYAPIFALLFIALSVNVILARRKYSVSGGDGGNAELQRRIAAQRNFSEYAPIFLILFAIAEFHSMPAYILHFVGILFLCGRIFHAYGILKAESHSNGKPANYGHRVRGMIGTFTAIAILACACLAEYVGYVFS